MSCPLVINIVGIDKGNAVLTPLEPRSWTHPKSPKKEQSSPRLGKFKGRRK